MLRGNNGWAHPSGLFLTLNRPMNPSGTTYLAFVDLAMLKNEESDDQGENSRIVKKIVLAHTMNSLQMPCSELADLENR